MKPLRVLGEEPRAVYDHLEFLKTLGGPPIKTVSVGVKLGDNLKAGMNTTGQRFVSIPAFMSIADDGQDNGIGRRQCTSEFKVEPIQLWIRRRLGAEPGKRVPEGRTAVQVFGLSFDEPTRVAKVKARVRPLYWSTAEFPLFDEFLTRGHCVEYLRRRFPGYEVPRSACVFCPYHSDDEWLRLKTDDPEGWARAVEIDEAIRDKTSRCAQGLKSAQYLHRSCRPLVQIDFTPSSPDRQRSFNFSTFDCEGMCGL